MIKKCFYIRSVGLLSSTILLQSLYISMYHLRKETTAIRMTSLLEVCWLCGIQRTEEK